MYSVVAKGGDLVHTDGVIRLGTIMMIGVALGMDAFSLGIGLGAQGLRWRDVTRLSVVISLLHVVLPLAGMLIGDMLFFHFGSIVQKLAAIVMMFLGSKMFVEAIEYSSKAITPPTAAAFPQLFVFALGVSIDALSVGLTLGTLEVNPFVSALIFGVQSGILAIAGLYIGRRVNQVLGRYGQLAGGAVLAVLGVKFFW